MVLIFGRKSWLLFRMAEAKREQPAGLGSVRGVCGTGGLDKTCGPSRKGFHASESWTWSGYARRFANTPMPPCGNTRRFVEWIAAWSARP